MSFYLLKSTFKREEIGDILIDLNKVESVAILFGKRGDDELGKYILKVNLVSDNTWNAMYFNIQEAKKTIKEILGDKISDQDLQNLTAHKV